MAPGDAQLAAVCVGASVVGVLLGLGAAVPIVAALPYDEYPVPPSAPPAPPDPPAPPHPPSSPPPPTPISPLGDARCTDAQLAGSADADAETPMPTTWAQCRSGAARYGVRAAAASDVGAAVVSTDVTELLAFDAGGVCAVHARRR